MRSMAGRWSDEHIATSLNRMGLPTGQGKTWTENVSHQCVACATFMPIGLRRKTVNG